IAAGACALALLVPAAATAMPPPNDMPASYGGSTMAGDTKSDLHVTQSAASPSRSEVLNAMPYAQLAAAYGINNKPEGAPVHARVVSAADDGTDGWRIAAVIEAGVLAAFALGAAVLVTGRQRRLRLGQ